MRARRRIAAAVGAAVAVTVVAVGVAVIPGGLHQHGRPAPATRHTGPTTVHPPGPSAPRGEIAWGLAGGRPWRLVMNTKGNVTVLGSSASGFVPLSAGREAFSF